MNRKTNIFYNNDNLEDSKFLTFSNYSEALTGDILALDYKLWPSRFICCYVKNLQKEQFIDGLQKYYENKLTTLRENVDDVSILRPLDYLIIYIYWYGWNANNDENKKSIKEIEEDLLENIDFSSFVNFNYISDIVEQQYNGTYSDIICTINPNKTRVPQLIFNNQEIRNSVLLSSSEFLYGWENTTVERLNEYIKNPYYDDISEIDNEPVYHVDSIIDKIQIDERSETTNLKFNLVIPLFNVINTENHYDITNDEEDLQTIELNNMSNIPLGIYFTDSDINLTIDGGFSTNWSLLISTQFSAFPFSYDIKQNFDDSQSIKQAYITFAEILANQTNFIDALTKYDSLVKSLQQRIMLLENKINNISSVQNIDTISQNIINIKNDQDTFIDEINNKIEELENKIEANKLKWQVKNN